MSNTGEFFEEMPWQRPDSRSESARTTGCAADSSRVVADFMAFCDKCGGVVAMADASTPESKKSNQKYAGRWAAEGYRVELVEHLPSDPMPKWCNCSKLNKPIKKKRPGNRPVCEHGLPISAGCKECGRGSRVA